MEQKKFTTEIQEYAYLKQWLTHKFADEEETKKKQSRFSKLSAKMKPTDKELAPFNTEIGRARSATLSHMVKELFSIPQRILLDKEVYRRIEGRRTDNFKFLLIPALADPIIVSAKNLATKTVTSITLNHKREGAPSSENMAEALKSEILDLIRRNAPQAMVSEMLAGAKDGKVDVSIIMNVCYKYHPEFPVDKTPHD